MPEESNGHDSPSRLDRIERAIEALIAGHEDLRVSQKVLLTAQVVMTGTVTKMGDRIDKLAEKVEAHEERIQALIDSQLRVDETLQFLKKLLERQPPPMGY